MLYLPQNSDLLLVQIFKDLFLDSPRIAHQLDMFIKHHTNINAIIHEANNRSKLEQYTKHKTNMKSL